MAESLLAVAAAGAAAAMVAVAQRHRAAAAERAPTPPTGAAAAEEQVAALLAGADEQQVAMMQEEIIVVDEQDAVLRPGSKKETHVWQTIQQEGLLHRAFSVFLLDPQGRLLVQQRAESKVTFPAYWANTCCSHPWHTPEELEMEGALGVKRAAIRKMQQELGIDPSEVPLECFTFLTRVHYDAPCDDGVWGEHEIDHVLIATPPTTPTLNLNPNEVQGVKWLTPPGLQSWLAEVEASQGPVGKPPREPHAGGCSDKVSPWFRIISQQHLPRWWAAVLADQKQGLPPSGAAGRLQALVEPTSIHRAGNWDDVTSAAT